MADSNRLNYETSAGNLDASATFQQLIEFLRKAEEDARALSARRSVAGDDSSSMQWALIARNFHRTQKVVTKLMTEKTKSSVGYAPTSH